MLFQLYLKNSEQIRINMISETEMTGKSKVRDSNQ